MLYKYQYPHHFCSVCFEEVCCSYSHHQRTNQFQIEKLWLRNQSDILYHFFLLPEGLFVEVNFPKVLPNLKMAFSIAFSLVSKFASCPVAATDIAGAGFTLTILVPKEITVAVIVEEQIGVWRALLLRAVFGTVAWLFIGGKVTEIMSLIS